MLNIAEIKNGLVIDHIQAGSGWKVFRYLGLDKAKFTTALIMNAQSVKSGKKDIIKIDNILNIDYSVLGYIDPNITVNVIQDSKITKKIKMELPDDIKDASAVRLIFESTGSKENPDGINKSVEALKAAGFNAEALISEGTAHEFLTWRRALYEMAQLLFKSR